MTIHVSINADYNIKHNYFFSIATNWVNIKFKGKLEKIRKARLCAIFQDDKIKISSDIKQRFIFKRSIGFSELSYSDDNAWRNNKVTRGEWIVVNENNNFFSGMIINFQHREEKTKTLRRIQNDEIVLSGENNNISVLIQPLFKIVDNVFVLFSSLGKYFELKKYVCHIKNDEIDLKIEFKKIIELYDNNNL